MSSVEENADFSVWAALLAFFEEGQDQRVQHPLQKRARALPNEKLSVPELHVISDFLTLSSGGIVGRGKLTRKRLEIQLRGSKSIGNQRFGEAFATLSEKITGKDFMNHPGYINYSKLSREESLEVCAINKMKSHIESVNEVICLEIPKLNNLKVALKINKNPWNEKTVWTDEDRLYCENLDKLKEHLGI